ncbi:lipopolysaccharide biosynthesis protein [Proteiniphilum sp.]|nr:oligosaccharide flippase family protein [Proteiniphilum sp.]MEA4918559.1 oligosaccharide flippase family protein [Proteiniphilum sp.]
MRKQIIAVFLGRIVAMICTFLIPLILTRIMPKSEYGVYQIFYTIMLFSVSFFGLGIHSNLYYFYPIAKDSEKRKIYISSVFIILFLIAILTLFLFFIPYIKRIFLGELEDRNMQFLLVSCIVLLIPTNIIDSFIVVKNKTFLNLFYPPFENILKVISIVGFYIFNKNVISVAYGFLFYSLLKLLFSFILVAKDLTLKSIRFEYIREQLEYGIPFGIAVSIKTLTQRLDKLILINSVSASAYASYSVAFFGIPGITILFDSFSRVLIIRLSELLHSSEVDEAHKLYKKLIAKTASITIPLLFLVYFLSSDIIAVIFTNEYLDAIVFFQVYLITIFLLMFCPGLILRAAGKTRSTMRIYLYSSLITIPTTVMLIKLFSSYGAIVSSVISLLIPTVIILNSERKLLSKTIKEFLPIRDIVVHMIISIAGIGLLTLVSHIFSNMIVKIFISSIVYLGIIFFIQIKLHMFVIEDIKVVRNLLIAKIYKKS